MIPVHLKIIFIDTPTVVSKKTLKRYTIPVFTIKTFYINLYKAIKKYKIKYTYKLLKIIL